MATISQLEFHHNDVDHSAKSNCHATFRFSKPDADSTSLATPLLHSSVEVLSPTPRLSGGGLSEDLLGCLYKIDESISVVYAGGWFSEFEP